MLKVEANILPFYSIIQAHFSELSMAISSRSSMNFKYSTALARWDLCKAPAVWFIYKDTLK